MTKNNQPVTEERLIQILDERLDLKLEEKLEEKLEKFRSSIMDKIDYIIGKYEATEEDRILAAGQTRDLRNDVEDHEKRIVNLEKKLGN